MEHRFTMLARQPGGWAAKWVSPGGAGVPDRILCLPDGRMFLVELTPPGGRTHGPHPAIHPQRARLGPPVPGGSDPDLFFRQFVDGAGDGSTGVGDGPEP